MFKSAFVFTAAARAALVGDAVLPKTRSASVDVGDRETVVHVAYPGSGAEIVPQGVRLLTEKRSDSIFRLKFGNVRRAKTCQLVFLDFFFF